MEIEHLNDNNFEEMTNLNKTIVIDFFATWCGPCKMMSPILERASEQNKEITFYKVDVDESEQTAKNFGIMSIPTLVLMKNGEEVARNVGLINEDQINEFVKK